MSLVLRKLDFCICKNKDADQLHGNREADQCLCFCYTDSTIPLLPKYEITSFLPSSVAVQPGLCRTWSETPKTVFLTTRLIYYIPSLKLEMVFISTNVKYFTSDMMSTSNQIAKMYGLSDGGRLTSHNMYSGA